jgi:hypothetical protein
METAREVFDSCCTKIAADFTDSGFRYHPTRHSAVKTNGDLKFEIHFQSSTRNYLVRDGGVNKLRSIAAKLMPFGDLSAFGNVTLIEHASVFSKRMKDFRRSVPHAWARNDAVTGGQIGNLQLPPKWVQFNVANPHTRTAVISEARRLVDAVAMPYFERFENSAEVIACLLDGSMPWTWEPSALEYACCFGDTDQALRLLTRFINEAPGRDAEYRDVLSRYRTDGPPDVWESTAPARLAKAALILGLDR